MKKSSFVRMIELGTSIFLTANVNAQSVQGTIASFEGGTSSIAIMAPVSKTSDKAALANIRAHNVAIYNHFIQNFRDAADIIAGNAGGKMFIYCKTSEVRQRVMYNKSGKWENTIRYYEVAQLDQELHRKLRYAYPDFIAFGTVTEIHAGYRKAYLVTIENCSSWKRIRMAGDDMDVYEEFRKG
jgi:hypothetical protein